MSSLPIRNFCRLPVKVIPQAPRNEVVGWLGDALRLKVHAPASEGRANDELCDFLARVLKISRHNVRLAHGERSRQKLIQIDGLTLDEVKARLAPVA